MTGALHEAIPDCTATILHTPATRDAHPQRPKAAARIRTGDLWFTKPLLYH